MSIYHVAAGGGNNLAECIRFRHLTGKLHHLGPRPLGEMLSRLARLHPAITNDMLALLEDYSAMDGAFLRAAGLDQWPHIFFAVPNSIRAGAATKNDIVRASLRDGERRL